MTKIKLMKKIIVICITALMFFSFIGVSSVGATGKGGDCNPANTTANHGCDNGLACQVTDRAKPAEGTCQPVIAIKSPDVGYSSLGNFINNVIQLVFAVAAIIVLVMVILGAYEWIVSGGDKEAVGKARNRILNALVGLAVLAVAFALTRVVAQFTGIDIFNLSIPTPNPNAPGI